ncbi:MAG: PIG-L deacetylase family protein [Desulfuromonadales bacterium]
MARILVIAPHADDEVLGVGGTIARRSIQGDEVIVAVMTGHGEETHPLWSKETWDIVRSEAAEAHAILGVSSTIYKELPAVLVPDQPVHEINKVVAELFNEVNPDILYIPFLYDMHYDHRCLVYACNVAWRPSSLTGRSIREIYMYETLSETHWNIHQHEGGFLPNVYMDISGDFLEKKKQAFSCFASQIREFPDARSIEGIEALAKWRGCSIGFHAVEAFCLVRKID